MRRFLIFILLVALCGSASAEMQLVENWSPSHPETQIYHDSQTGQSLAVISSGPRYMAPGKSLAFGPLGNKTYWVDTGYYYCEYNRETGRTAVQEVTTGSWTNWTPHIYIDNTTELSITGNPKLWDTDPISSDYHNNVVDISYGPRVTRRIRVIEGFVQEFYIISTNPRGNILISPTIEIRNLPSQAYYIQSADGNQYEGFTFNRDTSEKFITSNYFDQAAYPIIVDDSFSATSSAANDGSVAYEDMTKLSYATVHGSATGTSVLTTETFELLKHTYTGGGVKSYGIRRSFLYFNTTAIPSGSTVTAANLSIYSNGGIDDNSDIINITSGQPTYPRINLTLSDYDYTLYSSTTGGSISASNLEVEGRDNISLTTTGLGFINVTGENAFTKLALLYGRDISGTAPTGDNQIALCFRESGSTQAPYLFIYYTTGGPSAPVASFSCTPTGGVRNSTRTCTDSSTNTPTSWDWYGTGNIKCIGSNLTNQNPQLFPLNLSYCSLCLIATNAVGSDTECKNNYLWVMQPWVVGG